MQSAAAIVRRQVTACSRQQLVSSCRYSADAAAAATHSANRSTALLLGAYVGKEDGGSSSGGGSNKAGASPPPRLTPAGLEFDARVGGRLTALLTGVAGSKLSAGAVRVFYDLDPAFPVVCVTGIGAVDASQASLEELDVGRESVRVAVSKGAVTCRDLGLGELVTDPCGHADAAAEGVALGLFSFDELKAEKKRKAAIAARLHDGVRSERGGRDTELWRRGLCYAEGQNLARRLMEMPANKMRPVDFAAVAQERLAGMSNCEVVVRDRKWIEREKMGAFLSVSRASAEEPVFLEVKYKGAEASTPAVALVGKGVTFDTGGISLKPPLNMDLMRGDMGGAACMLASVWTAAKLAMPVNVHVFMPLCENMPGGRATKPGDVVTARNGKTIQVDNTDAEGRLILADALLYAQEQAPACVIDAATLTGAMGVALGAGAAGVFANSPLLWQRLQACGAVTGDRVWRMPLFHLYSSQMTKAHLADINNVSKQGGAGGACTAAAFLREFVKPGTLWAHLDIAGVMENKDEVAYLGKGMSGRPTRTIVELLADLGRQPLATSS